MNAKTDVSRGGSARPRAKPLVVLAVVATMVAASSIAAPGALAHYTCEDDLPGSSANHDCKYHWHTHHQHWHFGSTLSVSKQNPVDAAANNWTLANSEFYFHPDTSSPNHVGEHGISCSPSCITVGEQHDQSYTNGSPYHFLESDIHLNSNLNGDWNNNMSACPDGKNYDTEGITTHEFGHGVGLDHPDVEGDPRKTMVPGYYPKCWATSLESSDVDGMRAIYDDSAGD